MSADTPTGIADLVKRLESWGQNSPDPDFFQGDALSAVLADCAAAAAALKVAECKRESADLRRQAAEIIAARPKAGAMYRCGVCGTSDPDGYLRCYHPGCLDGRDR